MFWDEDYCHESETFALIGLGASTHGAKLRIIHTENGGIMLNNITGEKLIMGTGLGPDDDPVGPGFYVHDVGTGNRVINIRQDAQFAFIVDAQGNTGMGTAAPAAPLHVLRTSGQAQVRVESTAASTPQVMFKLLNNDTVLFEMVNGTDSWAFANNGNQFNISESGGDPGIDFTVFENGDANFRGDVTASGALFSSSRALKTGFTPVDEATLLAKVAELDISQWGCKSEPATAQHFGPMAEQFQAVFGLGDGKHLEMVDTTGIAFAAIQALEAENQALKEKVAGMDALQVRLDAMLARLDALEARQ